MFKKLLSTSLALMFGVSVLPLATPTMAQSDDYARLYQEFLQRIEQTSDTPVTQPATTTPAVQPTTAPVVAPQPRVQSQVRTNDYSLVGKVTRDENGAYFIHLADKPGYHYRVYGEDNAKDIMNAVKYAKVQLIGKKAYFNGKHVGISANRVVVLEYYPEKAMKNTPAPAPVVQQMPMYTETVYVGRIEISAEGHPYLKVQQGKAEMTYRLVNREMWKMAFEYAYKGDVRVRGWMNEKHVIRYSSITR